MSDPEVSSSLTEWWCRFIFWDFSVRWRKERRRGAHAVCYSRSALYCAGVLEAAGSGTSSGVVVSGAVPFLSCLAFRTRAARGWSGSITFRGCRRRGWIHTHIRHYHTPTKHSLPSEVTALQYLFRINLQVISCRGPGARAAQIVRAHPIKYGPLVEILSSWCKKELPVDGRHLWEQLIMCSCQRRMAVLTQSY